MSNNKFGDYSEDEPPNSGGPVVMAELVITNKLLENVIADAAERLDTIRQMAILGLRLEQNPQAYRYLFRAIKKIAMYPLNASIEEADFNDE